MDDKLERTLNPLNPSISDETIKSTVVSDYSDENLEAENSPYDPENLVSSNNSSETMVSNRIFLLINLLNALSFSFLIPG